VARAHRDTAAFAKGLGKDDLCGEQRVIRRRKREPYETRIRMPSIFDPYVEDIKRWLASEPRLTSLVILNRLAARCPGQFGQPHPRHRAMS
jgi:hypothetical protein